VTGVTAGLDHRHNHACLAQPPGRVFGEGEADAEPLIVRVAREHRDLAGPAAAAGLLAVGSPASRRKPG
jgi:hypothetical protein